MAKNQNEEMDLEQEEMTVTLTLDDGSEVECVVLTIFEAGDRDYIALLPTEGAEADEGEVYLYRYEEDADGNPSLDNIEDDDEYEVVADAFDELATALTILFYRKVIENNNLRIVTKGPKQAGVVSRCAK